MTQPLHDMTAVELAHGIVAQDFSCVEVVSSHLDRIDEMNGSVNAIVSMRSRSEIVADAAIADSMEPIGPLHGLPVAIKDLDDVAGLPTRFGSLVTNDEPASQDGYIAAQFRRAGAIIVGKTNTPEFGIGSHTFNQVFGATRNPWNLSRTAGGSSGGAAAAIAAHMLPLSDGSDLGGSLRNPAALCGIVGLRPSIGRVAEPDAKAIHPRLSVHGPMGRTVADTALCLSALAGPHVFDPLSLPEPGDEFGGPLPVTTSARLAWAGDLGLFTCEGDVLSICEEAARRIESVGGTFTRAQPDLQDAMSTFRVLRGVDLNRLGRTFSTESFSQLKDTMRENIEYGRSLSVDDILDADSRRADLHRTMASFFDAYDVLALPAAQVTPFPIEIEYPTEIEGVVMDDYLDWMSTACIITPTGCPAISVPAGFTDDGLPVGLQLVARVGCDRELLEIASAIESASPHRKAPQPVA
jgi:amidase